MFLSATMSSAIPSFSIAVSTGRSGASMVL